MRRARRHRGARQRRGTDTCRIHSTDGRSAGSRGAHRTVSVPKDPIVVYAHAHPDPAHNIVFWVFVRLNRPLPRTGPGRRANLLLEGIRGDGLPFTDSRKQACYSATIPADNAAQPVRP